MEDKNTNNMGITPEQEKKDRQLDNLINIVEKHTRTERHLEQYSDIGAPENKERARDKQDLREKQIDELKGKIIGYEQNAPSKQEQVKDIKENYKLGVAYLENKKEHMEEHNLQDLQRKQENRKNQLNNLERNMNKNN